MRHEYEYEYANDALVYHLPNTREYELPFLVSLCCDVMTRLCPVRFLAFAAGSRI